MLATAFTGAVHGVSGQIVRVEVDIAGGFPGLFLAGLPDSAVRESETRIRAAIRNSGFEFSWDRRITVNLAPASVRKSGSAFDLAIAIGILRAGGESPEIDADALILGELALDGSVRPISGLLPIAVAARDAGISQVIVPQQNAGEARLVSGLRVLPVNTLLDAVAGKAHEQSEPVTLRGSSAPPAACLSEVVGQALARRALEIAAAGGHNLLLCGPPGSGKTMLARCLPGILPPMNEEEAIAATSIHSAAGHTVRGLLTERPFRAPHHTASAIALVGGGSQPRPGEISLAHNGVLFLDELPEFPRIALECLRQPLEEGELLVSRARAALRFPARFQLVAAMNPCPCGFLGDAEKPCRCTPIAIARYQGRISGPFLDRIDLFVEVTRPEFSLASTPRAESSAAVRQRVLRAHALRPRTPSSTRVTRDLVASLTAGAQQALESGARTRSLSLRAIHRCVQVAQTIARLNNRKVVAPGDVHEALAFRPVGALTSLRAA